MDKNSMLLERVKQGDSLARDLLCKENSLKP